VILPERISFPINRIPAVFAIGAAHRSMESRAQFHRRFNP